MKKDLLISLVFVVLAALGIGGVYLLIGAQPDENAHKTIKPRREPIAQLPTAAIKEEPKRVVESIRKIPIKPTSMESKEKKVDLTKNSDKQLDFKPEKNKEPDRIVIAKNDAQSKIVVREPKKIDLNIDPFKEAQPANQVPDFIALGNIRKINNPALDFTVQHLDGEEEIILLGKLKTLKLSGTTGKSVLDASALDAQEIIFSGGIHGDSRVKLFAPNGTVLLQSDINGSAQIEIHAPGGKVIFQGNNPAIVKGGSRVTIVAKDVELNGEVRDGGFVTVTLTRGGSLKFSKLLGGARLHYGKANSSDPDPRIEAGSINPGTEFRKIEAKK